MREAIRWERRTLGIGRLLSPGLRGRIRQLVGAGPLQEGRRYAPTGGLRQLFQLLNSRGARYVVLRWFDGLPDEVDGDIDFLVADEDLPLFESLMRSERGGIPCDLYSESGVRGYRYADMPYFPPHLAKRILERAIVIPGPLSVPCDEDHFLSLAYHAVYQKGLRSGLPTTQRSAQSVPVPLHDYEGTLGRLARKLGWGVEISMEDLEDFLAEQGWRPADAVLRQLARHNPWLRERMSMAGEAKQCARVTEMQVAS
jgi:hypothetical protein